MQGHHGLAGARPAVDDQRAARPGADDRVLVGLDGAEHVPHPRRPAAAQAGDERGLVVERRACPSSPSGGEHLVPVVADPAAGPAVPAAARQPHRVGVGRAEERLGRRGAPVDSSRRPAPSVRPSRPTYTGSAVVRADHVPEAQVQAEPAQRAQPGGQPVDLEVAVHRLLPGAAGLPCARRRGGRTGRRSTARGSRAMAAKCCSSPAISAGSALAARSSGRSNALVVRGSRISSRPSVSGHGRRLWGPAGVLPQAPRCAIR